MASVQKVLRETAGLIHLIHTSKEVVPLDILYQADILANALTEYQYAVDLAQQKRTNYRGKRR